MALQFEGFIDNEGEYAALNCNCISDPKNGWTLCALAVVLHSDTVAFAYQQYFDGLRMSGGYLPYQAPQLKCIPVPKLNRSRISKLDTIGQLSLLARKDGSIASSSFIQDIGDAVVMECYFHDHMADRDLLFLDDLSPSLDGYDSDASETQQREFLEEFVTSHNAPKAKVRNKLLRLTADSPDLLAVIKNEGR